MAPIESLSFPHRDTIRAILTQREPNSKVERLLTAAARARSTGDLAAAETLYRQVVALDPAHYGALHNLGVIATIAGRLPEASDWYERALRVDPDAADTHSNLGVVFKQRGDPERATLHLSEAIRLRPGYAQAHNNLGVVRMMVDDLDGALEHFQRALDLDPANGVAWGNAGRVLLLTRGASRALEPLRRAVALAPRSVEARAALGAALGRLGRYSDAMVQFAGVLEQLPDHIEVLADLVHMRQHVCDWTRLHEDASRIRRYVASAERCGVSPFFFMMLPGTTAMEQKRCAELFARSLRPKRGGAAAGPGFTFSRAQRRRLRVGYLANHFHEHATMRLLVGVLERHDRDRFEVVGLPCDPDSTAATLPRLRAALDDLVDLRRFGDDEAARAIHTRGIDILIDGQGYNRGARPGILARRPAPVQAAYLVYPGTTGADFIDYLIADRVVIPPELASAYTERIKYLPGCYQSNDDRRPIPAPPGRAVLGLPAEGLVFCCFNQTYKITPEVFDIWCRLLREVPGSVLWLWSSNAEAPGNLRREAGARGVDEARVMFAGTLPAAEHLARLSQADLFLDTYPCNAHTTASDALWAGVPVVTRSGDTFVSRVGASVLHAAGLSDLVTTTISEYEALALKLARAPSALAAVRARVGASRAASPLFDTARVTRELEALYEEMWREYLGSPPGAAP